MQGILQSKDTPKLPSRNLFLRILLQKQGLRWQSEIYKDGWNEIDTERNGKDKSLLLHCLFFHNHITLPHSYRAALATQNNTFSTFRTYFSAKSNTKPSTITCSCSLNTYSYGETKSKEMNSFSKILALTDSTVPSLLLSFVCFWSLKSLVNRLKLT